MAAKAEITGTTGSCTWAFNESTGTLTISGDGQMQVNYYGQTTPWNEYKSEIQKVVIAQGVTNVGGYSFYECEALTSVEIASSVTTLGNSAFSKCTELSTVKYWGKQEPANSAASASFLFDNCGKLTEIQVPTQYDADNDYFFHKPVSRTLQSVDAYTITLNAAANGSISSSVSKAAVGETVTLTITPSANYEIDTVKYNDGEKDVDIAATEGVYSFIMPGRNVAVTATFKKALVLSPVYVGGVQLALDTNYVNDGSGSVAASSGSSCNAKITGNETDGYVLAISGLNVKGVRNKYSNAAIYADTEAALTIRVDAASTVIGADATTKSNSAGVYSNGDLTVTGTGKLTATAGKMYGTSTNSCGLLTASGKKITILNADIAVTGGKGSSPNSYSSGIGCSELVINNSRVVAKGGGYGLDRGLGWIRSMNITITNGSSVSAEGASHGVGLFSGDKLIIENSTLTAKGVKYAVAASVVLNGQNSWVIADATGSSGKALQNSAATDDANMAVRYTYAGENAFSTTDKDRYFAANATANGVANNGISAQPWIKLTVDTPDPVMRVITFKTDGGVITGTGITEVTPNDTYTMEFQVGVGATLPGKDQVSREGYAFKGWYSSFTSSASYGSTVAPTVDYDIWRYAQWNKLYSVAIDAAIQHGQVTASATSAAEKTTITLTVSQEPGYGLKALSVTDANDAPVEVSGPNAEGKYTFKMPASNVKVSASFEAVQITFNKNGGTGSMAAAVVSSADGTYTLPACGFTAPETTVPGGMAFKGWSYSKDGEVISTTSIAVSKDTELFAIWQHTPELTQTLAWEGLYNVSHTPTLTLTSLLPPDAALQLPVSAVTGSFSIISGVTPTFTGGSNEASLKFTTIAQTAPASGQLVLTLTSQTYGTFKFTVNVDLIGYKVAFDANGGSGSMAAAQVIGSYPLPECTFAAPNGKRFKGWALSENGEVITSLVVDQNRTLYAIWEDEPAAITGVTVTPAAATVVAGGTQSFTAAVTGTGSFDDTVQWSVTGHSSAATGIAANGLLTIGADETAASITVTAAAKGDSAQRASAVVTVQRAPAAIVPEVTWPTTDQKASVYEGESVTLTVEATNAAFYQWQINLNDGTGWRNIGENRASLVISAAALKNNGDRYQCIVTSTDNETDESPVFTLEVLKKVEIPQTGDSADWALWTALLLGSLGCISMLTYKRKEN
ncbi:MAG: InlB B-repeat-containing protein [Clostridia bacterium]|nr:InlB B-repeat-containing protein [Clostridia bacterium]